MKISKRALRYLREKRDARETSRRLRMAESFCLHKMQDITENFNKESLTGASQDIASYNAYALVLTVLGRKD